MIGCTVTWDYFADGADFDFANGYNVAKFFVNDAFIFGFDLFFAYCFQWVAKGVGQLK